MSRTPQQVQAAMASAAGLVAFDAEHTWRDVLFTDDGDLSQPGDPDRALLAALTEAYADLDRHADTLPGRLHQDWLERILGVPRLPVVPDTVVVHATVDPALAPAVVPAGTLLRGGTDAAGRERRYATAGPLTAHGATVAGVRSQVPGGHPVGMPGLVAEAPAFPLDPAAGSVPPHTVRLYSPVLAFAGGTLTVQVLLTGVLDQLTAAAALGNGVWRYPRLDGSEGEATSGTSWAPALDSRGVLVVLTGGCGTAGGDPWLELGIPAHRALPTTLSFTGATLQVLARSAMGPQAGFANDGAVDVSKEFVAFGPTARPGDALYLRCDEALAKPLATLSVTVEAAPSAASATASATASGAATAATRGGGAAPPPGSAVSVATRRLVWQRSVDGGWQTFRDAGSPLAGAATSPLVGAVASQETVVGGQRGRYVRVSLAAGDFGWADYQAGVAAFATAAAGGTVTGGRPAMPTPPAPTTLTRVLISYTTVAVAASRIEAVNGWAHTVKAGTGPFAPFTRAVSATGDTGMVAIGLDLPASAVGSSVSLYVEVRSATPCGSSPDPEGARWQWWDGTTWQALAVVDGTRLLRESGLLRFVAPLGWAVGSAAVGAVGADSARWVRLVSPEPERIGVIMSVTADAVLATFVSAAGSPESDPSPATALPPGTIKGTVTPVPGVKKATNVAGVRGRGPEDDAAYRRRASGLTRHRGRAISAWDYEELVAVTFAEVAAVRCLPHTGPGGVPAPGSVGLVVLPDQPDEPAPRPSVSLSDRITDLLAPLAGLHAHPTVLCPRYEPVTVEAHVLLRRGVAGLTGREVVTAALDRWLHPGGTTPPRWGRSLYRSSLEALLEGLPEVDAVQMLALHWVHETSTELVEVVEVDACRGLYCSAGSHALSVEEQL